MVDERGSGEKWSLQIPLNFISGRSVRQSFGFKARRIPVAGYFRARPFLSPKCSIDAAFIVPFIRDTYIHGILVSRINLDDIAERVLERPVMVATA